MKRVIPKVEITLSAAALISVNRLDSKSCSVIDSQMIEVQIYLGSSSSEQLWLNY